MVLAVVILATVGLAVLLFALLPGAGLAGAVLALLLGAAVVVWLLAAGAMGKTSADAPSEAELLGPGGLHDPRGG